MPGPNQELLPGIKWGSSSQIYTPAYWKLQYLMHTQGDSFHITYRLGANILEEVVACLLGGYGLKAEVGLAAFDQLKKAGLIRPKVEFQTIRQVLLKPLTVGENQVRYRFPNQKAKFISEFLQRSDLQILPIHNDIMLRDWLLTVNGIGPKTASWITRNYCNSENVAIIDIHIFRACLVMGLFNDSLSVLKDYFKLEELFLYFCNALNVLPSRMDALMWLQMKASSPTVLRIIKNLQNT